MSSEIRYPLGGDLYATVTTFNGTTKVHIRRFTILEGENSIRPTKFGVTLDVDQFRQLNLNCSIIEGELFRRTSPLEPELLEASQSRFQAPEQTESTYMHRLPSPYPTFTPI